jgi:hypothetical protein
MGASSDDDMWRILLALLANRVRFEDQHPRYAAFIAESPSTAFGYSSCKRLRDDPLFGPHFREQLHPINKKWQDYSGSII